MEWISILLETQPKKNGKSHVIKGIAKINEQLYLLDYVLFSNFEWWNATLLNSDNYEAIKNSLPESTLYYNSQNDVFAEYSELPENIQKLVLTNIETL